MNLGLVKAALDRGSDPNEAIEKGGPSAWAAFLAFLADTKFHWRYNGSATGSASSTAALEVLFTLVHAGAARTVPLSWLEVRPSLSWEHLGIVHLERTRKQWLVGLAPLAQNESVEAMIAVSDVIRSFHDCFEHGVDHLVAQVERLKSQASTHARKR